MSKTKHYCGMYIPLSDDKHRFLRDSSLCALEIRDNVRDNFFPKNFFFLRFCLGLHTAVVFRMQSFNVIQLECYQITSGARKYYVSLSLGLLPQLQSGLPNGSVLLNSWEPLKPLSLVPVLNQPFSQVTLIKIPHKISGFLTSNYVGLVCLCYCTIMVLISLFCSLTDFDESRAQQLRERQQREMREAQQRLRTEWGNEDVRIFFKMSRQFCNFKVAKEIRLRDFIRVGFGKFLLADMPK